MSKKVDRKPSVAVFWDFDTCSCSVYHDDLADTVKDIKKSAAAYGRIARFRVYSTTTEPPRKSKSIGNATHALQVALNKHGVGLNMYHGADERLSAIVSSVHHILQTPSMKTILFVTSNRDSIHKVASRVPQTVDVVWKNGLSATAEVYCPDDTSDDDDDEDEDELDGSSEAEGDIYFTPVLSTDTAPTSPEQYDSDEEDSKRSDDDGDTKSAISSSRFKSSSSSSSSSSDSSSSAPMHLPKTQPSRTTNRAPVPSRATMTENEYCKATRHLRVHYAEMGLSDGEEDEEEAQEVVINDEHANEGSLSGNSSSSESSVEPSSEAEAESVSKPAATSDMDDSDSGSEDEDDCEESEQDVRTDLQTKPKPSSGEAPGKASIVKKEEREVSLAAQGDAPPNVPAVSGAVISRKRPLPDDFIKVEEEEHQRIPPPPTKIDVSELQAQRQLAKVSWSH